MQSSFPFVIYYKNQLQLTMCKQGQRDERWEREREDEGGNSHVAVALCDSAPPTGALQPNGGARAGSPPAGETPALLLQQPERGAPGRATHTHTQQPHGWVQEVSRVHTLYDHQCYFLIYLFFFSNFQNFFHVCVCMHATLLPSTG